MQVELLLLPAPASVLRLAAPPPVLLLPAPRMAETPQPRIELFWDVPRQAGLPVDVQAALDPVTEQLLKRVREYLGGTAADADLLTRAVAEFTREITAIGRETCGFKAAPKARSTGRTSNPRPERPTGKARSKAEMDAELNEIVAERMDAMRQKFGVNFGGTRGTYTC